MPHAVIDLGTNTFQLLIAELHEPGIITPLVQESRAAKIGLGGISEGLISEAAMGRALDVLTYFREKTDSFGIAPQSVRAIGTSAVRSARNQEEFIRRVREKTEFNVEVIQGEREAELIFKGVSLATPLHAGMSLIMDIGGGSVEFILANAERVFWKKSIELGGQRLMDRFMTSDPMSSGQIRRLYEYVEEQLLSLTNAVHQYAPLELIGSAGSFETMAEMTHWHKTGRGLDENWLAAELSLADFQWAFQQLLVLPRAERLALPGMVEPRVDMIVVAVCLADFVLKHYAIPRIRVSTYALKEGVLSEQFGLDLKGKGN